THNSLLNIVTFAAMLKQLPNLMTVGNLLCGCLAIVSVFHGQPVHAAWYVGIAAVLDFLDGFVARLVNGYSELGKQLDSLADMVTFGVVPGVILYHLMLKSSYFVTYENRDLFRVFKYYMFLVTAFSCIRLAKFNIDIRQTSYFIGVPTPINTMAIVSLWLMVYYNQFGLQHVILNPWVLVGIASISSALLIAEIPLISLKFKNFRFADNKGQFILLTLSIILIPLLKFAALPAILILYILLSAIYPPVIKEK
ncbi:MAG: CDP-diacylglycerol--serine O-phosphatidyltransferase, partial [Bacteroidota bacterium]